MSNMSHCRFKNTYEDLVDCMEAIDEAGGLANLLEKVDPYEKPFVKRLIALCSGMHGFYGDEK
jgi:hypothetical protein